MEYRGGDYIYFASGPENMNLPSVSFKSKAVADTLRRYTFYYDDKSVTQAEIKYHLYVSGGTRDYDRPFRVEQVEEAGVKNAVPGIDYLPFDSDTMKQLFVIKAGQMYLEMPVVILRTKDNDEVVLRFRLVENEYFSPAFSDLDWRKAIFTSYIQRPNEWTDNMSKNWYGTYSLTKHEWFIEVTGYRWDDEFMLSMTSDLRKYLLVDLAARLKEINAEREKNNLGPWTDENGVEIKLGTYAYTTG